MPALLLDAHWNVVQRNQGAQRLWRWLLPDLPETPDTQALNLLDGLVHPPDLGRRILNLAEVGPAVAACPSRVVSIWIQFLYVHCPADRSVREVA